MLNTDIDVVGILFHVAYSLSFVSYFADLYAGLIYVIDSDDPDRMEEAREELDAILAAEEMHGVPLLVMANKQDLPQAEPLPKIVDALCLRDLKRPWHIQACCAVNGDGILEGMQRFADMIKAFKKSRNNW